MVFDIMSQMVHVSILEVLTFCNGKHDGTISSCQELTLTVQQFQGIPLTGIMRGRNDDTAICTRHPYSEFCRRRGGKTNVNHIIAHSHQCSAYHVLHHLA